MRGSSSYIAINAHGKNKEAAKAFIRWLFTPESQIKLQNAAGGTKVATNGVPPPADFLKQHPWAEHYFTQAPRARTAVIVGFEEKTPQIRHALIQEFAKILLSNADTSQALARAQSQGEQIARK